jgi:ubiquinone/menaquinone biosynthesis C-methylase UbiE
MAMETVNVNRRVLDLLELEGGSRVLEVGFGHGRTLARVSELAPKGLVAGIDISAGMVQMAQRHNRDAIAKGLIEIKRASSNRIPYPDESFDRAYAVHTLYFWNDPLAHLREIHRVTRVGGRFVLAFGQAVTDHSEAFIYFCENEGRFVRSLPSEIVSARRVFITFIKAGQANGDFRAGSADLLADMLSAALCAVALTWLRAGRRKKLNMHLEEVV